MKALPSGFLEFDHENQVGIGTTVILRVECERQGSAMSPYGTMLVENIELGETSEKNVYHLARVYLRMGRHSRAVIHCEDLKITGFKRFSESIVAHNHGDNRPYVMARDE